MNWIYGKQMVKEKAIESLKDWSEEKETTISKMDMYLDYLWYEDENGIHFIDRLYSDGIIDNTVKERQKTNELELHFKNIIEVTKYLNDKLQK